MKAGGTSYRVAVSGASSLLGKELISVLEQRSFPVSRLISLRSAEDEPDLPILDLHESYREAIAAEDISAGELDFAFLAARTKSAAAPSFLRDPGPAEKSRCAVIDVAGALPELVRKPSIPFLERDESLVNITRASAMRTPPNLFASAHPATIMMSSILLRLETRCPLKAAVAQVFAPASEIGASAVEELQRQTVNLLSFQKIPREVFGAQLAFNLLPRLGRAGEGAPRDLEHRVRSELRRYLAEIVPVPALRVFHVPVFYSLGLSLYVETSQPVTPDLLQQALEGERIRVRRSTQDAPSQVEVAGSSDILVDAVTNDPNHPTGIWIWAVADNICLAAVNAVEIAESLKSSEK